MGGACAGLQKASVAAVGMQLLKIGSFPGRGGGLHLIDPSEVCAAMPVPNTKHASGCISGVAFLGVGMPAPAGVAGGGLVLRGGGVCLRW